MEKVETNESWLWSPSLRVGVDAIDEDHKQLFKLFNDAHSLCREHKRFQS